MKLWDQYSSERDGIIYVVKQIFFLLSAPFLVMKGGDLLVLEGIHVLSLQTHKELRGIITVFAQQ